MTASQGSRRTEGASGDDTSRTDERNRAPPNDGRFQDLAIDHLRNAIDADELPETNYHVRAALQALVIAEENRPG